MNRETNDEAILNKSTPIIKSCLLFLTELYKNANCKAVLKYITRRQF